MSFRFIFSSYAFCKAYYHFEKNGHTLLELNEPDGNESYYYFTNIETSKRDKSIGFLYLPSDSDKDIYVDGIKAEKLLFSTNGHEFYICYAISNRDTSLSNFYTSISDRHKIIIK